jgi:hypothetical protein
MARHFLFPICFILTAVPWPHQFEVAIVQNLTKYVGATAAECANWMGIAALPKGNLIQLTNGYVGIAEACSGIRSLQAILDGIARDWRITAVLGFEAWIVYLSWVGNRVHLQRSANRCARSSGVFVGR